MSAGKIVLLIIYAVLVALILTQGGTAVGLWSARILGLLVVVHVIETLVFFKFCKEAGGSLPVYLLNVFLFGVLHIKDVKEAQAKA